jgi:branched-chain amino acid transport system ATP-binding protein
MNAQPGPESLVELLELRGAEVAYGRALALRGVDLRVRPRGIVGLLGANGAGKTTLLRLAAGLLQPREGRVLWEGSDVGRLTASARTRLGICLIPEGRGIFRGLSVRENLELFVPPRSARKHEIEPAIEAFPILGQRLQQQAGSLSGGEQQMLAVAKAYLSAPKLVMADELSLGLAPMIVDEIYASLKRLSHEGVGLLIVEQYVNRIRELADEIYVMARGQVAWYGPSNELTDAELTESYLGSNGRFN